MTGSEDDITTLAEDLRTMDEALDAGAVTAVHPLERELQELALGLRAEAAEPSGEFAAELRDRVRDGFPRDRPRRPRLPLPGRFQLRRPPLPVIGGLASIVVALAGAGALVGEGEDEP